MAIGQVALELSAPRTWASRADERKGGRWLR